MEIVDVSGKRIYQKKVANSQMSKMIDLSFLKLKQGVYFVVFKSNNQTARGRIVIQ
jgi:hypothetical protein